MFCYFMLFFFLLKHIFNWSYSNWLYSAPLHYPLSPFLGTVHPDRKHCQTTKGLRIKKKKKKNLRSTKMLSTFVLLCVPSFHETEKRINDAYSYLYYCSIMDLWCIYSVHIFMKLTTLWKVIKWFQKGLFFNQRIIGYDST